MLTKATATALYISPDWHKQEFLEGLVPDETKY